MTASAQAAHATPAQPEAAPKFVGRHQGLKIYQDEDGFCAQNGDDYAADNEPTLDAAKAAIDDYFAGTQFGPLNGFFTGADQ